MVRQDTIGDAKGGKVTLLFALASWEAFCLYVVIMTPRPDENMHTVAATIGGIGALVIVGWLWVILYEVQVHRAHRRTHKLAEMPE